jgi:hypothetical protein
VDQHGIKETKEAILALVVLGKFVADRLKDGAGFDDALALGQKLSDQEFKAKVLAGVDGIDKIPAEVKDISLVEVFELAKLIPDILVEIQK